MNRIGILGGSGLYDLPGLTDTRWVRVDTPLGAPSDELLFGTLGGLPIAFLPRHGRGHRIPPHEINFRANIDALKRAGVTDVLSLSAVGCLREDLTPGTFVVVDQFIDRTLRARRRSSAPAGRACLDGAPGVRAARRAPAQRALRRAGVAARHAAAPTS